jgi:hypothetical protein
MESAGVKSLNSAKIQNRLGKLEATLAPQSRAFSSDTEGNIPDDFRPERDLLILHKIVAADGTKTASAGNKPVNHQ